MTVLDTRDRRRWSAPPRRPPARGARRPQEDRSPSATSSASSSPSGPGDCPSPPRASTTTRRRSSTEPYAVFDYVEGVPPGGHGRPRRHRPCPSPPSSPPSTTSTAGAAFGPPPAPGVARQFGRPPGARVARAPGVWTPACREGLVLRGSSPRAGPRPTPTAPPCSTATSGPGNLLWRDDEIVGRDRLGGGLGRRPARRRGHHPARPPLGLRLRRRWRPSPTTTSSLTAVDPTTLPLWDLAAALRPAGVFSAWVADWADFGRPDMDSDHHAGRTTGGSSTRPSAALGESDGPQLRPD